MNEYDQQAQTVNEQTNVGGQVGDDANAAAIGQNIHQRIYDERTHSAERRDTTGANITFHSQDTAILWQELRIMGDKIARVDFKLDDLPNRVGKLEIKLDPVPVPLPVEVFTPLVWVVILLSIVLSAGLGFWIARGF